MDGAQLYAFLEKEFVATFLDELLPGIFHNYANPLNGIMGRSKLLQRRLVDFINKLQQSCPDLEGKLGVDYKKLLSDIDSINSESEKFYDIFRISTGKFYALGTQGPEKLNLSNLVEAEMGFGDFYLDFKHSIQKELLCDRDSPDLSGVPAYYSMAVWMLIRLAMNNLKDRKEETFCIAMEHDERRVYLKITHIGNELMSAWNENTQNPAAPSQWPVAQKNLLYALLLLKEAGNGAEITYEAKTDRLTVAIPIPSRKEAR